jgi:hypothetical protein
VGQAYIYGSWAARYLGAPQPGLDVSRWRPGRQAMSDGHLLSGLTITLPTSHQVDHHRSFKLVIRVRFPSPTLGIVCIICTFVDT